MKVRITPNVNDEALHHVVDVMANPALMLNSSGIVCHVNRSGQAYFSRLSQVVLGSQLDDLLASSTGEWAQRIAEVAASGQTRTWNFCDESAAPLHKLTADLVPWLDQTGRTEWILMILDGAPEEPTRSLNPTCAGPASLLQDFRSRFISMASHEFRTPLSVIYSSAELLEHFGAQWPIEKQHKHLKRIQAHVRNMINLLDDALLIDRIDSSNVTFKPGPIDLAHTCRKLIDEVRHDEDSQHAMTLAFQGTCTEVVGDEQLLRYIVLNLLSNAVKYSPPDRAIGLDVICREEGVTLIVRDEGRGIPAADLPHVFERFQRASNVGSIPGTGLGLSIVKYAVDLLGGTIDLDSRLGHGTCVKVTLPAFARQPEAAGGHD